MKEKNTKIQSTGTIHDSIKYITLLSMILLFGCNRLSSEAKSTGDMANGETTPSVHYLSVPRDTGNVSVEEALQKRRSRRNYLDKGLPEAFLSQILWAAYGITKPERAYPSMRGGYRTSPSAGALYPLEIYVLAGRVEGIAPGVYRYHSLTHSLEKVIDGDMRNALRDAALGQEMIVRAPAVLLYCAVFERCVQKYGQRGRERYVCMEAGHSAQNVYLQAEALNIGTCAIGAFNDDRVRQAMKLSATEEPLYIMPVGYY